MVSDAGEHVAQIGLGIDAVDRRGRLRHARIAFVGSGECDALVRSEIASPARDRFVALQAPSFVTATCWNTQHDSPWCARQQGAENLQGKRFQLRISAM